MEKNLRAELIASLITDKYSGFKEGDETFLETASDARLEEFRAASDTKKAAESAFTRLETEQRNTAARLKVAEDRIKASEQPMSEDDFLARAPASIKALLEAEKQKEDAMRAALVSKLKDLGADTEEELKKKSIPELQTLAKYARVEISDFRGRGLPVERSAGDRDHNDNYAPPNPYEHDLKVLQSKTVN